MLTALLIAALLAGLAGAWSPCGFSMVETIAPHGYAGRLRTTAAAAPAFALGALAGGTVTFGGLALAGRQLGTGGATAAAAAAALLIAAAFGDAGGRRILPQVRRQVPESWRRRLPLPLAAGLYGVLLGLGFTTFVLSFATYALAAACLALGDAGHGVLIGLAFGLGRTLPVVVLAPLQDRPAGAAAAAAMAERPAILRSLRAAAAAALLTAAAALLLGAPASARAADLFTPFGADPSTDGDGIVWQGPGGEGLILREGRTTALPGSDPALGGGNVAWTEPGEVVVASAATFTPFLRLQAPGARDLAVSATHVAWRVTDAATDRIFVAPFAGGAPTSVATVIPPASVGRPALDSTRIVFHVAGRTQSRIQELDLVTGARRTLRRARGELLLHPDLDGPSLLYVRSGPTRQKLVLGTRDGADVTIYSTPPTGRRDTGAEAGRHRHGAGYPRGRPPRLYERPRAGETLTLWSTSLSPTVAYVTRLKATGGGTATAQILRVLR